MTVRTADARTSKRTREAPQVVKFGYRNFQASDGKTSAVCKFCCCKEFLLKSTGQSSSNYLHHLRRRHPEKADEYQKGREILGSAALPHEDRKHITEYTENASAAAIQTVCSRGYKQDNSTSEHAASNIFIYKEDQASPCVDKSVVNTVTFNKGFIPIRDSSYEEEQDSLCVEKSVGNKVSSNRGCISNTGTSYKEEKNSPCDVKSLVNKFTNNEKCFSNSDARLSIAVPTPLDHRLQIATCIVSNQLPTAITSSLGTNACSRQMPFSSPSLLGTFMTYQKPSPLLPMLVMQSGSHKNPVTPMLFAPIQNSSILIPTAVVATLNEGNIIEESQRPSKSVTEEQLPASTSSGPNIHVSSNQVLTCNSSICDTNLCLQNHVSYLAQRTAVVRPLSHKTAIDDACTVNTDTMSDNLISNSVGMCRDITVANLLHGNNSSQTSCCNIDTSSGASCKAAKLTTGNRSGQDDVAVVGTDCTPAATGTNSHCCPYCNEIFSLMVELQGHLETEHCPHVLINPNSGLSACHSINHQTCNSKNYPQNVNRTNFPTVDDTVIKKDYPKQIGDDSNIKAPLSTSSSDQNCLLNSSMCAPEHIQKDTLLQTDEKSGIYSVSSPTKLGSFHKKEVMLAHFRKMPVNKKKYMCSWCKVSSQYRWKLFLHMMTQHLSHQTGDNYQVIKCPHCDCSFPSDYLFSEHMKKVHGKKYCYQCSYRKRSQQLLFDHIVSAHFEEFIQTGKKKSIYVNTKTIRKELQVCLQTNEFRQCPFCPFKNTKNGCTRQTLKFHLLHYHLACERTAGKKIMCCHCSDTFDSDIVYRMHIRQMHNGHGYLYCPFCPRRLKSLNPHIMKVHGPNIAIPKCSTIHLQQSSNASKSVESYPPREYPLGAEEGVFPNVNAAILPHDNHVTSSIACNVVENVETIKVLSTSCVIPAPETESSLPDARLLDVNAFDSGEEMFPFKKRSHQDLVCAVAEQVSCPMTEEAQAGTRVSNLSKDSLELIGSPQTGIDQETLCLKRFNSLELNEGKKIVQEPSFIPLENCIFCPQCDELFCLGKEFEAHMMVHRASCSLIDPLSLADVSKENSHLEQDEIAYSKNGVSNTSPSSKDEQRACSKNSVGNTSPSSKDEQRAYSKNSVGNTSSSSKDDSKQSDDCSSHDGNHNACQVLFNKIIGNSFNCKHRKIQEHTFVGEEGDYETLFASPSGEKIILQTKEVITAFVIKMSRLDFHTPSPAQLRKCPFCKTLYRRRWNLFLHMMTQHLSHQNETKGEKIKCPHCDESFVLDKHYHRHMKRVHHYIDRHCCSECSYVSPNLQGLYHHTVSTHFIVLGKVNKKLIEFVNAEKISEELERSPANHLRQCPFCPFTTIAKKAHARITMRFHLFHHLASERTANGLIKCCHCSDEFQSDFSYRKHIKYKHKEKGLRYCPFCPCKVKKLTTHFRERHGSKVIMPTSSKRALSLKKKSSGFVGHNSIRIYLNSDPDDSASNVPHLILPFDPILEKCNKSCSVESKSSVCEEPRATITSTSTKFDQDERPVKRRKTCSSGLISPHREPQQDIPTHECSPKGLLEAQCSGISLPCDKLGSEPHVHVCDANTSLINKLTYSEKFQLIEEEHAYHVFKTKRCPHCGQSVFLEEMYEHFLTKHKEKNICFYCIIEFSSVAEIFEHTWLFHFKLSAQLLTTVSTRYYSPEALRLILRKALLNLQNSGEATLKQCPLCDFGCMRKISLTKNLSHHLVLCHIASERSPQNNIKCPHCTAMITFEPAFRGHLKFDHNSLHTFHCPFCPFKCAAHRALLLHNITAIHGAQLLPELCLDVNALLREDVHGTPSDDKKVEKPLEECRSVRHAYSAWPNTFKETMIETSDKVSTQDDLAQIKFNNVIRCDTASVKAPNDHVMKELALTRATTSGAACMSHQENIDPKALIPDQPDCSTQNSCEESTLSENSCEVSGITSKNSCEVSGITSKNSCEVSGITSENSCEVSGITSKNSCEVSGITSEKSCEVSGITSQYSCEVSGITSKYSCGVSGIISENHCGVSGITSEKQRDNYDGCSFESARLLYLPDESKERSTLDQFSNFGLAPWKLCPLCGFWLTGVSTHGRLFRHIVRHHLACETTDAYAKCPHCSLFIASEDSFRKHLKEICQRDRLHCPPRPLTERTDDRTLDSELQPELDLLLKIISATRTTTVSNEQHVPSSSTCTSATTVADIVGAPTTSLNVPSRTNSPTNKVSVLFTTDFSDLNASDLVEAVFPIHGNHCGSNAPILSCESVVTEMQEKSSDLSIHDSSDLTDSTQKNIGRETVCLKIHPGEMCYVCPHCGEQFSQKNDLQIHSKEKHAACSSLGSLPIACISRLKLLQIKGQKLCSKSQRGVIYLTKPHAKTIRKPNDLCPSKNEDDKCHITSSNRNSTNHVLVASSSLCRAVIAKDNSLSACINEQSTMNTMASTKHRAITFNQKLYQTGNCYPHNCGKTSTFDNFDPSDVSDESSVKRRKICPPYSIDPLRELVEDSGEQGSSVSILTTVVDAPETSCFCDQLPCGSHIEVEQSENKNMIVKAEMDCLSTHLVDDVVLGCMGECVIKSEPDSVPLCSSVGAYSITNYDTVVKSELECFDDVVSVKSESDTDMDLVAQPVDTDHASVTSGDGESACKSEMDSSLLCVCGKLAGATFDNCLSAPTLSMAGNEDDCSTVLSETERDNAAVLVTQNGDYSSLHSGIDCSDTEGLDVSQHRDNDPSDQKSTDNVNDFDDERSQGSSGQQVFVSCPRCPFVTDDESVYEQHLLIAHKFKKW